MKIAILLNGTRISPRYGFANDMLLVSIQGGKVVNKERLSLKGLTPYQIPAYLASLGVTKVIAGGIHQRFQELFKERNIQLIWGIIGDAEDALNWFLKGRLTSGIGICYSNNRRRRRRGRNF